MAACPFTGVIATVGVHAYDPPDGRPVPTNVVVCPKHRLVSGDVALTVEAKVSVMESLAVQPVTLSVTVSL